MVDPAGGIPLHAQCTSVLLAVGRFQLLISPVSASAEFGGLCGFGGFWYCIASTRCHTLLGSSPCFRCNDAAAAEMASPPRGTASIPPSDPNDEVDVSSRSIQ